MQISKSEHMVREMIAAATEYILSPLKDAGNGQGDLRVVDLGEIYRQHMLWNCHLGRVQIYYAMKANRDPAFCYMLRQLGSGFNCESMEDVQLCLRKGCDPQNITYTKRYKPREYLKFARENNVSLLSFDTAAELDDIKAEYPEAKLLLRISTLESSDITDSQVSIGAPMDMTIILLEEARRRSLNVMGVCFHADAPVKQPSAFLADVVRGIKRSRFVIDYGAMIGYELKVVDIGGGFQKKAFESLALQLNVALDKYLPASCTVLAEPGQFYSRTAVGIAKKIVGERIETNPINTVCLRSLYLSSSAYSTFLMLMADDDYISNPVVIQVGSNGENDAKKASNSDEVQQYTVRELAGYPFDRIGRWEFTGNPRPGDWLFFSDVGGYTSSLVIDPCYSHPLIIDDVQQSSRFATRYICTEESAKSLYREYLEGLAPIKH